MARPSQITSREFNQDTASAKRAARKGPVFITDRGEPAFVLLAIDQYRSLVRPDRPFAERIGDRAAAEVEFELPRTSGALRPVSLD